MMFVAGLPCANARADASPGFAFNIDSARIPGGILAPIFVGTDPAGKVHISSLQNVIKLAEPNGAFISRWGTQGTGPGQFSYAGPLAFDNNGHVFVLDEYNDRIEEFDTDGNFIVAWGSHGAGPGQFDQPDGLAINSSGRIYVSDSTNFRIQMFSSPGVFLTQFGSLGTNAGFPGPIATDSSNNVYVLDAPGGAFDNFRVQKFDADGKFLSQWGSYGENTTGMIQLGGITTDPSNNVYVVDGANNRVQKFTSDGVFVSQWGSLGTGRGQFNSPGGIAVDSTGNYVYVADYYNSRISVFAYAGLAPLIYQSLTNQTEPVGATVSLQVGAFGAQPLTFQWQLDGTNLPGATAASLVISNVSFAASGTYSVSASNSLGTVFTPSAVLSVLPVVVTTFPVSGISATGAVLNGSVLLGSNPSSAWFEWGSDTNYGNVTGVTNLDPNTTVALNDRLANLSGDIVYHYRLVGSNSLGVVYGEDSSFQIGAKPTVVTLPVISASPNSVVLSARVNPQGRQTSAYFRWGAQAPGHNSPTNQLLSEVTNLTVQDQITGLVPGVTYVVQAVAFNELGTASGKLVSFIAPPLVMLPVPPQHVWSALATSAEGDTLAALADENRVYISQDSGMNWITNALPSLAWKAIAISADARRLIVAAGSQNNLDGAMYSSTNLGSTWTKWSGPQRSWGALAASADGLNIAGVDGFGQHVLTSTNGGVTWATNSSPFPAEFNTIASSADGQKLIVAAGGLGNTPSGPVFTTADFGSSWTSNSLPLYHWQSVASSADGKTPLAAVGGQSAGPIFVSTNGGNSWAQTAAPLSNWQRVAVSADGTKIAALIRLASNPLFTSTNAGLTWNSQRLPQAIWSDVVLSADGARLFAAGDHNILTVQNPPTPILNTGIGEPGLLLSWVIPSVPLLLQQSSNLSGGEWTNAPGSAALLLTNLHYQLTIPATSSASFFRLKSAD